MRILVYPHAMEIGGSQLNAIELAAGVRDRGHDVSVTSGPGPLVDVVRALGLVHIPLPPGSPLSMRMRRHLVSTTDKHKIDIVHGYEWPPAIALYFGPHLMRQVPAVCTVMSMAVASFIPSRLPLIVGTEDIKRRACLAGHTSVTLLEPPVDTNANAPGFDGSTFRTAHSLDPDKLLIVVVGRLSKQLKLEGLLSACDAIGAMAADGIKIQLVVVGDGDARDQVAERASRANSLAGERTVTLIGSKSDPRPAYAAADVLLGMGGSALRGMAFGKPLIVQGELGFWRLCTPESATQFLKAGWYGLGDLNAPVDEQGLALGAALLRAELEPLVADVAYRNRLGAFGRQLVVERFSIARAAALQEEIYMEVLRTKASPRSMDVLTSAAGVIAHTLRRRLQRWIGTATSEDFNSVALQKTLSS